jgi:hypothetical protein
MIREFFSCFVSGKVNKCSHELYPSGDFKGSLTIYRHVRGDVPEEPELEEEHKKKTTDEDEPGTSTSGKPMKGKKKQ